MDYANHFGLDKKARLNTNVHAARYIQKTQKWELTISSNGSEEKSIESFDKVVFAMGTDQKPMTPKIPGIEKFKGFTQHSIGFKE